MSAESLKNKVAVVTGASRGIGLAIAEALAREGCRVVITARNAMALKKAAGELRSEITGATIHALECDVTSEKAVGKLFASVKRVLGRVDVLVNNAGVAHPITPVKDLPYKTWREVVDTNLTGTFLCTRAAIPLMKKGGMIINNLSIAAHSGFPGFSAYDASKRGALGFTNTLREELRESGIRVLALLPGATATDIWDQFMPQADRSDMIAPQSVAAAVVGALKMPAETVVEEIRMMPISGTARKVRE